MLKSGSILNTVVHTMAAVRSRAVSVRAPQGADEVTAAPLPFEESEASQLDS